MEFRLLSSFEALTAGLQKVSAQLDLGKSVPQVVNNPRDCQIAFNQSAVTLHRVAAFSLAVDPTET